MSKQRLQSGMLNNSLAILEGTEPEPNNINFIWTADPSDVNLFTPKTAGSPKGSWYWLQDGVVINDKLYLFPLLMVDDPNGEVGFQFSIAGVTMVTMPISEEGPLIEEQKQIDTPLYKPLEDGSGSIIFGAAILDTDELDDNYMYVYGYLDLVSGMKELVLARVMPEKIDQFEEWQYWNGDSWSSNIFDVASLVKGVSPELSVSYMKTGPYKDKYIAVYEKDTLSGYIAISSADNPEGPFSEEILYYVPEANNDDGIITYNAKAHPHLSNGDELLISYNVNSTRPNGNTENGDIYRPRWIKIRDISNK